MALFGNTQPKLTMPERLKKLQESLYGSSSSSSNNSTGVNPTSTPEIQNSNANNPPLDTVPPTVNNQIPGIPPNQLDPGDAPTWTDNTIQPKQAEFQIVESFLNSPESTTTISADEMKLFGLYAINAERQARGFLHSKPTQ